MPKQQPKREPRWRAAKIQGSALKSLGYVYAWDKETAIQRAIEQYEIRPELQNRIVVTMEP